MNAYLESCQVFLDTVKNDLSAFAENMNMEEIEAAAQLIIEAQKKGNRVHVSGIGKPGHIAGYISSVMSSTGNPTYFLHGTEAVHGSCGQLVEGDIVIFISNSGETAEMRSTVLAVKKNVGDAVKAGDVVIVLEAMKMENDIVAPCDGTVKSINAPKGSTVNTDDVLAVI